MITILKSHLLYTLATQLSDAMRENCPAHPLHPQTIIVPNLDTAKWLKLELAERMNIAANLECILPSEWLYRQIRRLYPDLPKKLPSDLLPMTWSIYNILIDDTLRPQYTRVDNYVGRQDAANVETATWQLSGQIASLFDEYIVYRPELVLGWQEGRTGKQPDEEWQSQLWNQLNRQWKSLPDKSLHKNRAELFRDLQQSMDSNLSQKESYLFVFNPGLIPKPILNILKDYGNHSDVSIYRIVPSSRADHLTETAINPILSSFGRESEELELVFNEVFGYTGRFVHDDESHPNPVALGKSGKKESLLGQIQTSIIENQLVPGDIQPDKSIHIHSCHSPLREVEVLHQALLELFEQDQTLHPDDVLVSTPDPDLYEPFVRAVFGTVEEGLPEIPWHISASLRKDSTTERTFTQWLHIPDSRFQFQEVMELFSMQPIWEKAGLTTSDVEIIKQWMEENSVIWGLDEAHRREVGQPATDYQTWESALKRGWFGQWMADKPGMLMDDTLLYSGVQSSSQKESWAAFSSFIYGLDRFRKEVKELRSALEWCDVIRFRFEQLVGSELLGSPEGYAISKTLDTICESVSILDDKRKIPFSLIRNMITEMLDQSGSSGAVFTRGVTFSSMVPVRSIPFRVVALIGLNESSFPRKQSAIDFDLMALKPKPGERNRKFEDRNLFLESILSAKDSHYVSYVGQSPVDNDEIPPSTIVNEWIDLVAKTTGRANEDVISKEALHFFSEQYFIDGKSYSATAFQTAKLLADSGDKISGLSWSGSLSNIEDTPMVITVNQLTRFYKNPIQSYVTDQLGARLRDPEEDKDEFSSGYLDKYILFQQLFGWMLTGMKDTEMYRLVKQSGQLPDGFAGEKVFKEKIGQCKTALRLLDLKEKKPITAKLQVDTEIDGVRINDVIPSYLDGSLLDITPSSLSGSLLIQSWIRHLVWNLSTGSEVESYLLCELKDSGPKWVCFSPAEPPSDYLRPFVEMYQKGLKEPLLFFPKSLYTYEDTDRSPKNNDPFTAAERAFEGGAWSMGERMNINLKALLGSEAQFKKEYHEEPYRSLISSMMDHMEVLK